MGIANQLFSNNNKKHNRCQNLPWTLTNVLIGECKKISAVSPRCKGWKDQVQPLNSLMWRRRLLQSKPTPLLLREHHIPASQTAGSVVTMMKSCCRTPLTSCVPVLTPSRAQSYVPMFLFGSDRLICCSCCVVAAAAAAAIVFAAAAAAAAAIVVAAAAAAAAAVVVVVVVVVVEVVVV
eukprot:1156662-Pelagomonas_calceolata.AAC.1